MFHERDIEYTVAAAIDDARCALTRAYAANDPEMREVAKVAIGAVRRWDLEHREHLPDEVLDALAYNADAMSAGIGHILELEAEVKRLRSGSNNVDAITT